MADPGWLGRARWVRTARGYVAWAETARGLRAAVLPCADRETALAALGVRDAEEATAASSDLAARLIAFYAGEPVDFADVALDLPGETPFQAAVRAVVRGIPRGETLSYGEVAAAAGRPGGARAVGQVMARNPVPPIIPCHRVLAAGGKLGGYGGGEELKRALLALETC